MFFKNPDYFVISANDNGMTIRIKATNKIVTVNRVVGDVLIDFNNEQYNSDHRFERHNSKPFFKNDETEIHKLGSLPDRSSLEVTSVYEKEKILDDLINKEDAKTRKKLIDLLPEAVATLTDKQKYVIKRYYFDRLKKKVIAKELGISAMMVSKHTHAGLAKLHKFYQNVFKKMN